MRETEKLDYTSGVMVSLGLKKPRTSPTLWFYIYDEDILPARVYAPNIKSKNNVPEGCSSLQAEIYYSRYRKMPDDLETLKEDVIDQMLKLGVSLGRTELPEWEGGCRENCWVKCTSVRLKDMRCLNVELNN